MSKWNVSVKKPKHKAAKCYADYAKDAIKRGQITQEDLKSDFGVGTYVNKTHNVVL